MTENYRVVYVRVQTMLDILDSATFDARVAGFHVSFEFLEAWLGRLELSVRHSQLTHSLPGASSIGHA